MKKRLTLALLLVTFVGLVYGLNPDDYAHSTELDGYVWEALNPLQRELVVFGFVQGMHAAAYEQEMWWGIDSRAMLRRWQLMFDEYVFMVSRFYRMTKRLDVPIWMVLYAHGDEGWLYEYFGE